MSLRFAAAVANHLYLEAVVSVILVLLTIATLALILSNVRLLNRAIVATRVQEQLTRSITVERKATASLIRLASEEIGAGANEVPFLKRYCDFARRTVGASGVAAFMLVDEHFEGAGVCGLFPPLEELPDTLREQLFASPEHHNRHIRTVRLSAHQPELERLVSSPTAQLYEESYPTWFPARSLQGVTTIIIAPITARRRVLGMVIAVQDSDSTMLNKDSAEYLLRLGEIAGMCLDGMRVSMERMVQEQRLRQAHEEGMLQVTSGMVHNIGNAVTVAQLITSRLLAARDQAGENVVTFLVDELLPVWQAHQQQGDLAEFLTHDEDGRKYLDALLTLLPLLGKENLQLLEQLQALDQKLLHITEIIDLQQHFVGELGTEELIFLEQPIRNALTIVRESAEKRDIQLDLQLGETTQLLADRTMMTQVFLNLITNALEACERSGKGDRIEIRTYMEKESGREYVVCAMSDNGPGIEPELRQRLFELGCSSKNGVAGASGKGLGLHFCRQTVSKYDGSIVIESTPPHGTTIYVRLPV